METIFSKINRYFAFTRKDRNGIYILLLLIVITIAIRTGYPFWKKSHTVISAEDTTAAVSVVVEWTRHGGSYGGNYDTAGVNRNGKGNVSGRHSIYTPPSYMQKKVYVVELNSADTLDLKELRGIGSTYARRIVAYREKLGGFMCKEQLHEVWGIDTVLYARIVSQVTVDISQVRKIDLNSASIDLLKRHPYLDYYLAKEVVKYREKYGNFSTVEDMLKVNLMDENTFNRIKSYLMVHTK